jgi:acetyl-CoA acetyltransferase
LKAVVSSYALTTTSRGKVERGDKRLSPEEYLGETLRLLLENSGLEKSDIDNQGLAVSGMVYPHSDIWSSEVAQLLGLHPKWLISSDHGGASGIDMLAQAVAAVEKGIVESVVCLGVDAPLSMVEFGLNSTGYIRDYENPSGIMGPNSLFAIIMRRHMKQYGTKLEQIGKVTVDHRKNAAMNPTAYLRKEISIEDYLNSRLISDPIKLLDCCLPVNQGLGFVVTNEGFGKRITDRPVFMLGFAEEDAYYHGDVMLPDITHMGISAASKRVYKATGLKPSDFDFAQIYDDYAIAVLMQVEDLGFCAKGDGGTWIETHDTTINGSLPINTGGGQIASGQPGLAGGLVHVVEAITQLRGEGGKRQVKDAELGCVTGIGGLAYGRNLLLTSVGILSSSPQKGKTRF